MNARGRTGTASLHIAAAKGSVEAVKVLLAAGAVTTYANQRERTCLMDAVAGKHVEVVKLLLQHGADSSINSNKRGCTALMLCNDSTILKLLLAAGADVHCTAHKLGHKLAAALLTRATRDL